MDGKKPIETRQEVAADKLNSECDKYIDLIHALMRRKLGLFGHVCTCTRRMEKNRKIKDVMMGMIEGTGRRGRPCREWMNGMRDWCID